MELVDRPTQRRVTPAHYCFTLIADRLDRGLANAGKAPWSDHPAALASLRCSHHSEGWQSG